MNIKTFIKPATVLSLLATFSILFSNKAFAQAVPTIEVTDWKPAYQADGSVINAGEITLTLKNYSGEAFPGSGTVYSETADGNVIPVSTAWIKNGLDNTWVWKMYIPGSDPIRYYKHLYMDDQGINIDVNWKGKNPWKTNVTNTGITLSEYITTPDASFNLIRVFRRPSGIKYVYLLKYNPSWVNYPFDNLIVRLENPTCPVKELKVSDGKVNGVGIILEKTLSYIRVYPTSFVYGKWTLLNKDSSGNEIVWDSGTAKMPRCKPVPHQQIRR